MATWDETWHQGTIGVRENTAHERLRRITRRGPRRRRRRRNRPLKRLISQCQRYLKRLLWRGHRGHTICHKWSDRWFERFDWHSGSEFRWPRQSTHGSWLTSWQQKRQAAA